MGLEAGLELHPRDGRGLRLLGSADREEGVALEAIPARPAPRAEVSGHTRSPASAAVPSRESPGVEGSERKVPPPPLVATLITGRC